MNNDWDDLEKENSIKEKLQNLSKVKKVVVLILMISILASLIYISTIDKVETFKYKRYGEVVCKETYVNGELNTTPCPQNPEYNDAEKWETVSGKDYENWTSK